MTTTERRTRNRSAACGAWEIRDTGRHAHDHCYGSVNLPPPDDECSCPCHAGPNADPDPVDDPAQVARARARAAATPVPDRFYCEECRGWTPQAAQVPGNDDLPAVCADCVAVYLCGECGYEIDRHGYCRRPADGRGDCPEGRPVDTAAATSEVGA